MFDSESYVANVLQKHGDQTADKLLECWSLREIQMGPREGAFKAEVLSVKNVHHETTDATYLLNLPTMQDCCFYRYLPAIFHFASLYVCICPHICFFAAFISFLSQTLIPFNFNSSVQHVSDDRTQELDGLYTTAWIRTIFVLILLALIYKNECISSSNQLPFFAALLTWHTLTTNRPFAVSSLLCWRSLIFAESAHPSMWWLILARSSSTFNDIFQRRLFTLKRIVASLHIFTSRRYCESALNVEELTSVIQSAI